MFDAVRNNKRVVQIFLALITLPFAFWGVDSYVRNSGVGTDVASVGDTKITVSQFDRALRERQEQMQQTMGASFKPEMINAPEVRLNVLNSMIDQRLVQLEADKKGLLTGDGVLRDTIGKIPALQDEGKFSMEKYERALRAQGKSQPQFEAEMRQDLTMQQLLGPVGDATFVSQTQADALLRLQLEERQFGEHRLAPEQFAGKVKIEADTVKKFYEDNKPRFEIPEQIKVEYLTLSLDAILPQVTISDAEIKTWYESNKDKKYQQQEERRASHILFAVKNESEKAGARSRAEEVLKEVVKAPAKFAELAKKNSDDTVTAKVGGDLGFFARGMMVKAFDDAVFRQKDGEISDVLESEFGFHIIKLTGIKPGKVRGLDEVRSEIESDLKRQSAMRKFAEAAEAFNNTVYEQSDSLQPAADKFKLKIQQSGWLTRNPEPKDMVNLGPLANPKILASLFSEDALKNKRNIEAYEIAPNTLLSARVVEHVPAAAKPFDSVKADIEKYLKTQEVAVLATKAGEERLAELNKGGADKLDWSSAKSVSRLQARELPPAASRVIFKADVQKLPAYVGTSVNGGYSIFKILKVTPPEKLDDARRKSLQSEFGAILAQEDLSAYLNALRMRYRVEINKASLESRER